MDEKSLTEKVINATPAQSPVLVKPWIKLFTCVFYAAPLLCSPALLGGFIPVRCELCSSNVELSLLSPCPFYSRERERASGEGEWVTASHTHTQTHTHQPSYRTVLLSGRQPQQQWSESGQGSRREEGRRERERGEGYTSVTPSTPTQTSPHPSKELANKTQDPLPLPPLHGCSAH